MIVVDTNVIAYLMIPGDYTAQAQAALWKDPQWAAPLLWRSEFNNVLALYMRQGELSCGKAVELAREAQRLLAGREYRVPSHRILEQVSKSPLSAYDCEFVILAQDLSLPLITADGRILAHFPDLAAPLEKFAAPDIPTEAEDPEA